MVALHRVARLRPGWPEFTVFAIALAGRLAIVALSPGGFHGLYPYDPGVYYAASDALTHGLLPYRDFLLVHPPGLPLALTPFAVLGRLTSDQTGFLTADLAETVLGAVNAALVVRLGRRLGFGRTAATLGGLFYAVCLGSVVAEFSARLEPLGNTLLLGALFLISGSVLTARRAVGAGLLLGCAVDVKLWWLAPAAVVVLGVAVATRSVRRGLLVLGGVLVAVVVVLAPFFCAAPHRMFRMIVSAQLQRSSVLSSFPQRLSNLVTAREQSLSNSAQVAVSILLVAALVVGVAIAAWRRPAARLFAALLVTQFGVLVIGPAVFGFYVDYLMVPAGIVLAGGADAWFGAERRRARAVGVTWVMPVLVAGALLVSALVDPQHPGGYVGRFAQADRMKHAATRFRCLVSDSPTGLIVTDSLDRSFAPGCHDWVDVTAPLIGALGRRYIYDPTAVSDKPWADLLQRYLASGDAVLVIRTVGIGLGGYNRRALSIGGAVAGDGLYTIYRTVPASRVLHP